jgi:hypothetical protein
MVATTFALIGIVAVIEIVGGTYYHLRSTPSNLPQRPGLPSPGGHIMIQTVEVPSDPSLGITPGMAQRCSRRWGTDRINVE